MIRYTCNDFRREMVLAGLKRRMARSDVSPEEKTRLEQQVRELEAELGMD